jgi:hypothetical protein
VGRGVSLRAGVQRTLLLTAAVLFGIFFVVAFVFRRLDVSQDTLSIVGGVLAYTFLVVAAVIGVRAWRRRGQDVERPIADFLADHPSLVERLGRPVAVGPPSGAVPSGTGPGQANLSVPVSGPAGGADVDLVMARLGRRWEVLSAALVRGGERFPLRGGVPDEALPDR